MGIESPHLLAIIGLTTLVLGFVFIVWAIKRIRYLSVAYDNTGVFKRIIFCKVLLVMFAGLFIATALANPYYTGSATANTLQYMDGVIVNDDSVSMGARAERGGQRRLDRAKIIAADLADGLGHANIAVCEFTDRTFCRARFGSSHTQIIKTIKGFEIDAITGSGSEIGDTLSRVANEFPKDSDRARFIFLISDGGEELSAEYYQKKLDSVLDHLQDNEIAVVAIGVGEDYYVPVVLVPYVNSYGKQEIVVDVDDKKYEVIYSKLEENKLKHIAAKTGGVYIHEDEFNKERVSSFVAARLESSGLIRPATSSLSGAFIGAALVCLFIYGLFFRPSFRRK
ncbi:MAG: VWA domain-containing protein [Candidatus Spechtbacterales bacterium]